MNNDFQAPPPSYAEIQDKSLPLNGVQGHASLQQGQYVDPRYGTANQTVPIVYAVQTIPLGVFSRNPVQCTCSHCGATIVTRVQESSGLLAWLLCALLIVFGCWLGCCFIPFCISDLQNVKHYCPNCRAFLAEYRPL